MPITVTYQLRQIGKQAPVITTSQRMYAYLELTGKQQHAKPGEHYFIKHVITPTEPMTKPEQYLLLVYETRHMQRYYFANHSTATREQNKANLDAALAKETALDRWNAGTRAYIDAHPGFQDVLSALPSDSERARHFAFFLIVEEWRKLWLQYFAYKKKHDKDLRVEKEIKKQCFDYEEKIDSYITKALQL